MQLSEKHKAILGKIWKVSWQGALIGFITLLIFETIYRLYWVDFYRYELEALNPEEDLNLEKEETILIFGDSFTADPNSWVSVLRDSLDNHNIINSALPGTSVFHQQLFFEDRIEEFNPDQILIQLYVGNDLIDYNRPQDFSAISWARNLYWWFSDQFISLQFINYKMGQFKAAGNQNSSYANESFDPEKYNSRTLNYLAAYPDIVAESINPNNDFADEMEDLVEDLQWMVEQTSIPVTIIVIPHCVQTDEAYRENYINMGATIDQEKLSEFIFFDKIQELGDAHDNVKVTSPIKVFQNTKAPYYNNDPHLTPSGQYVLGKFILTQVEF